MLFDPIWFILIQFDSFWSNLIHFDPIWFILIHFDPIWFILIHFDPFWFNFIQFHLWMWTRTLCPFWKIYCKIPNLWLWPRFQLEFLTFKCTIERFWKTGLFLLYPFWPFLILYKFRAFVTFKSCDLDFNWNFFPPRKQVFEQSLDKSNPRWALHIALKSSPESFCDYNMVNSTGCGVFKRGGIKSEIFLPKNQHIQRKFLNWCNGKVSKIRHHFRK